MIWLCVTTLTSPQTEAKCNLDGLISRSGLPGRDVPMFIIGFSISLTCLVLCVGGDTELSIDHSIDVYELYCD